MKRILLLLVVLSVWNHAFGQIKTLDECIQLALVNNPDLLKSGYALEQSRISVKQAVAGLYPSAAVNASTATSGPLVDEVQDPWDWSLGGSVNQQFYYAGMYSGIKLARVRQRSSEYSEFSMQDQIRASVARLYFQILASDTLIGVYKSNIRLSDEQIKKMTQMVELGLKRQSDLLKSQVQRGTFESQLVRELEARASSKRALNIVMGQQPNVELDIEPLDVHSIMVPDYEVALNTMLENNPSLKQYKAQMDVQELSLRMAREAYLPSVSGSYSVSQRNGVFGGSPINSDQISLRLSIDLFDGFNKNQNVQKSKLNVEEAQLDYEAALRDFDEALSNQYRALDTQNQLIEIHRTNLTSARKDLEVVSEQYAAGFSSILDLTDAQVSVLESETNLLRDLYSRKQIEAEILRLIGR
ncbi:TolC family protein [candidate division KSB1 bacterium]|nr:TolC family protein [candidate division KSB1 bacterium]